MQTTQVPNLILKSTNKVQEFQISQLPYNDHVKEPMCNTNVPKF